MAQDTTIQVNQFEGFGNDIPKGLGEYYRSSGMAKRMFGISACSFIDSVFDQSVGYSSLSNVTAFAYGRGRDRNSDVFDYNYFYAYDIGKKIMSSKVTIQSTGNSLDGFNVHYETLSEGKGLIVDQKNRLLYPQTRYLGMHDPSTANYKTGTINVTNGSNAIVGVGTTFTSAMATNARVLRIIGENTFYRVTTFTDATHITIDRGYEGGTATGKSFIIYEGWTDKFKDFGANLATTSTGGTAFIAADTYEDTVLFGRNNIVHTLNTLTDSLNTAAFTLPTGFDILTIHSGSNGILIGCNFKNKGVLVLWDNYSDRSIAPWIQLTEHIKGVAKYNGAWVVYTARNIYYTNGYSLVPILADFLDSSITTTDVYGSSFTPFQTIVVGSNFYFNVNMPVQGRKRAGLYRLNLNSKLLEYVPLEDLNQIGITIWSLFFDADFLLAGTQSGSAVGNSIGVLKESSAPAVASYITLPVDGGTENLKAARGIKLPLGFNPLIMDAAPTRISFTVVAKIHTNTRELNHYAKQKVTTALLNQVTIDGTVYSGAEIGDEVEFLDGNNAGRTRHITAISGQNTATEVWTLDSDLPYGIAINTNIVLSPFKLIERKTYQSLLALPNVFFNIPNAPKGRQFMMKFEIIDSTVPIDIRPFDFTFDDLGKKSI